MADLYVELARSSETALAHQRDKLRSILESAAEGILTIDAGGHRDVQSAAENMFGWSAHNVEGHDLSELLTVERDSQPSGELLEQLVDHPSRSAVPTAVGARRKDGSSFPIEISASVMQRDDHRKYVAIVRDISERIRLQQRSNTRRSTMT